VCSFRIPLVLTALRYHATATLNMHATPDALGSPPPVSGPASRAFHYAFKMRAMSIGPAPPGEVRWRTNYCSFYGTFYGTFFLFSFFFFHLLLLVSPSHLLK
jgi:hypothetical protein